MHSSRTVVLSPLLAFTLLGAACGDDAKKARDSQSPADTDATDGTADVSDSAASDAGDDTAVADTSISETSTDAASEVTPSACSSDDRRACLYRPAATYAFTSERVDGLTYPDLTGATRNVNIAVYRPTGAPTPAPVVLLSHGGADGKTNPMKSMEHWAPVFAAAGYVTVAIAHEGRELASYEALCDELGVNRDLHPCGIKISWDRPHDVDRVLEWLQAQAAVAGPDGLQGVVDLSRIAHVGHSAGAGAALMSVGATRNYVCALPWDFVDDDQSCQVADLVSLAKPDVDIAVALSPQGPGSEGFMMESYGAVTRPTLMGTGAQDGDVGEPENRLGLWPQLPANDKFKLYVDDIGSKHTLFEGSTTACEREQTPARCEAMQEAIFSTGLAFVEAYLRGDATAKAWLASEDLVTVGNGVFTFERK